MWLKFLFFLKKSLSFLRDYFLNDPLFVILYIFAYFQKGYINKVKFYSEGEVITLFKKGKSYIRYGDGEVALMHGRGIDYQQHEVSLSTSLKDIVAEYSTGSNYVLAVPERYINKSNTDLKKINLFNCWLPMKVTYNQLFPKNIKYADAHSFYVSGFFEKKIAPFIKSKKLIIVTTKDNIHKQKSILEKEFDVLFWIEAKSPNPFDWLNMYKQKIQDVLSSTTPATDVVVLASCGPASKVLAYEMCNQVQVLDLGHGIEYLYRDKSLDHVLI